jgi:predicted HicB family RNase H-like nuclease
MADKYQEVLNVAQELCSQDPDWVMFFREILGIEGAVRKAFATPAEMAEFERSHEYAQIQGMLARLRERGRGKPSQPEPTRVITVRLPKSLHDSLRAEAHERRTSMNRLCIAKLLQVVDEQLLAAAPMAVGVE